MASARSKLGGARRGLIKRQKKTDLLAGIGSAIMTAGTFAYGQAKKAGTAWDDYQAGYEAVGGTEPLTKPKFGEEGWLKSTFKGPSGEVRVGEKLYDVENLTKAGTFLGGDDAAIAFAGDESGDLRKQYLKGVAPGVTQATTFTGSLTGQTDDTVGVGVGFGQKTGGITSPDFLKNYVPDVKRKGTTLPVGASTETEGILTQQRQGKDPTFDYSSLRGSGLRGSAYDKLVRSRNIPDYPKFNVQQPIDQSYEFGEGGGAWDTDIQNMDWGNVSKSQRTQAARKAVKKKQLHGSVPQIQRYAKGGDFITSGPQKILVGDNPGGRERVTIEPLSPRNDEGKFGRYGDDRMKIIDGKLAHISPPEEFMSPEQIKEQGAGTTNPITGKKEYFLGSLIRGFAASGNKADVLAGKEAAGEMFQEKMDMIGSGYDIGMQELSRGTVAGEEQIIAGGEGTISQQNLATSTIQADMERQKNKLFAGHLTTAQKIADTRTQQERSVEDWYESTLTELETIPTSFLGGVFG